MKKLFGKRGIALLTTLALVISMVAMLGGLTASAAEYTPKRAITFTASEGIHQACLMLENANDIAAGQTVTISGYYKVDSLSGTNFAIDRSDITVTEPTDGWVEFSFEYSVPNNTEWNSFGLYNDNGEAAGEFALADITFTDADGKVLYDFATDVSFAAGTHEYTASHGYDKMGIWYVMGCFGEKTKADASCTVVIDPVYTAPAYTPKRTMSVAATVDSLDAGDFQAAFMMARVGEFFGYSTEYTVKGYYKVADFVSVDASSKATLGAAGVEQVAEWTAFETTYTSNASGEAWSDYGFWNAGGTLYLADIVLEKDGVVVYDMATDVNLVAGEYTTAQTMGIWYLGKWGAGTGSYKFVIDEAVEAEDPCANGHKYVGGVCERCGDEKEYPVIPGDTTYEPKRVVTIETWGGSKGTEGMAIEGKMLITKGGTYFPNNDRVIVKGYYKIENFKDTTHPSGYDFSVQIGAGGRSNGEQVQSATGNTDGWVEFAIGYRPKDYGEPDWNQAMKFGFWWAHGKLSIADITIESMDGEVLYDMAYDEELIAGTHAGTTLQEGGDATCQMGMWWLGAWGNDDWADMEIVIDEALDKPAQTGDADIFFVVALGTMAAITLAVVTLNKKKFSV